MASSTIEAKYIAIVEAIKQAAWLRGLIKKLGIAQKIVCIYCDSQSTVYLAKDSAYHTRTKHINFRYHKLKKFVASDCIQLIKIPTQENTTDIITKLLPVLFGLVNVKQR